MIEIISGDFNTDKNNQKKYSPRDGSRDPFYSPGDD